MTRLPRPTRRRGTGRQESADISRPFWAEGGFTLAIPIIIAIVVYALLPQSALDGQAGSEARLLALRHDLVPVGAFFLGRVLHAWGISQEPEVFRFRTAGMGLTFTVLGVGAAALLGLVLAEAFG